MHLMSSKALGFGEGLLPGITFSEIYQSEHAGFKNKYCANDFKNSFSLTKILVNYKNKPVIFTHSSEEGNCCTCSTMSSKDSDKFHTKPLKKIWLRKTKKLQTFIHIFCTSLIPSSQVCISDHQACSS